MQRLTRFALRYVPSLVICLFSFGGLCVAQEIEIPSGPRDRGYVFAPTGYVELIAPLQDRIGLRLFGFYAGELKAPGEQVDVPIRVTKFLTITPSYSNTRARSTTAFLFSNISRSVDPECRPISQSDKS
jgi:hypothetical protein